MTVCNNFAIARLSEAAAAIEDNCGVAKFPTAAQMFKVVDALEMSQVRPTTNSDERSNSRGISFQFQGAKDAGTWSAASYLRPAGTAATASSVGAPQCHDIFHAFFGRILSSSGMQINDVAGIDDAVTTIPFDGLVGEIPDSGVIKIGTELIYYPSITWTDPSNKVAGSFTGVTRGYEGTTAASALDGAAIGMWSRTYALSVNVPSITFWGRQDFMYHAMLGAVPDTASLDISNSGGATFNVSGQGFEQLTLSRHTTNSIVATASTTYTTDNPTLAEVGMYIQNSTLGDDNSGAGYEITSVVGSTVTITPGVQEATGWTSGDTIDGFLPDFTPIGEPVENRQTVLRLDGVQFPVRTTTLNMSEPKNLPTDENGTDGPTGYIPGQREYAIDMNVYAKPDKLEFYKASYDGVEMPIEITYGVGLGNQIVLTMPRVKFTTPTISEDSETFAISFSGTLLDVVNEDSFTMRFE